MCQRIGKQRVFSHISVNALKLTVADEIVGDRFKRQSEQFSTGILIEDGVQDGGAGSRNTDAEIAVAKDGCVLNRQSSTVGGDSMTLGGPCHQAVEDLELGEVGQDPVSIGSKVAGVDFRPGVLLQEETGAQVAVDPIADNRSFCSRFQVNAVAPVVLYLIVLDGESRGLTLCQYSIVLGLLNDVPFDQSR